MPVKPDRKNLPEWLKSEIMSVFMQALHAQGIDTMYVPYAGKVLKALEERVTQHTKGMTQDFTATLQELESLRQQYGLKKTFLDV